MATIHPSRLGLVPPNSVRVVRPAYDEHGRGDDRERHRDSGKSADKREGNDDDRETRRERDRSRERGDRRGEERDRERARDKGRGGERERDRDREREGERGRRRSRSRSPAPSAHGTGERRRSPEYGEYKRPSSPPRDAPAPWRVQENMYPPRGQGRAPGGPAPGWSGAGGGGADFIESRRKQRENTTLSIWPASPKEPSREWSPTRGSKSKARRSKKKRSNSVSSDSPSSEDDGDRRRRERKDKKQSRKAKEKGDLKDRRKRRHATDESSEDDDDRKHKRRHRSHRSASRSRERSHTDRDRRRSRTSSGPRSPPRSDEEEDQWVEKAPRPGVFVAEPTAAVVKKEVKPETLKGAVATAASGDEDSDEEVGPQPALAVSAKGKKVDERDYGGALLRGEGSAMAAFLQEGGTDARIPRRGEIGLESDQIAAYESVGYVMSGSRHRRMNAVRMRKENQVISAEEKRGILKLQREERERREAILRDEFKELVQDKLKGEKRF